MVPSRSAWPYDPPRRLPVLALPQSRSPLGRGTSRCALDSLKTIALDEAGGESSLDRAVRETTLVDRVFRGVLRTQVRRKSNSCVEVPAAWSRLAATAPLVAARSANGPPVRKQRCEPQAAPSMVRTRGLRPFVDLGAIPTSNTPATPCR